MARIRTLKPEIWLSPQVMNLPFGARLLFIGLITQADDQGRGSADSRRLKAAVYPGDDVSVDQVREWLDLIATERLAVLYETEQHGRCFHLPTWLRHQSISRSTPSHLPRPEDSMSTHGGLPEDSGGNGMDGNGTERKVGARAGARATLPEGLNRAAWDRWREFRAAIRKPIRPASEAAAMAALAKFGADQAVVVEQSIAAGWQGLFALKDRTALAPEGVRSRTLTEEERAEAEWQATLRSARARGIDPTGLTASEIEHRCWENDNAKRQATA